MAEPTAPATNPACTGAVSQAADAGAQVPLARQRGNHRRSGEPHAHGQHQHQRDEPALDQRIPHADRSRLGRRQLEAQGIRASNRAGLARDGRTTTREMEGYRPTGGVPAPATAGAVSPVQLAAPRSAWRVGRPGVGVIPGWSSEAPGMPARPAAEPSQRPHSGPWRDHVVVLNIPVDIDCSVADRSGAQGVRVLIGRCQCAADCSHGAQIDVPQARDGRGTGILACGESRCLCWRQGVSTSMVTGTWLVMTS